MQVLVCEMPSDFDAAKFRGKAHVSSFRRLLNLKFLPACKLECLSDFLK